MRRLGTRTAFREWRAMLVAVMTSLFVARSLPALAGLQAAPEQIRECPQYAGDRRGDEGQRAITDREVGNQCRGEVDGEARVSPFFEPRGDHRDKQRGHARHLGP